MTRTTRVPARTPTTTSAAAVAVRSALLPLIALNPFDWLGEKAKEGLADGWTAVMISLWSAGLWLLEAVFKLLDRFLTPDLTDPGLVDLHSITLWISLVVALVIGCAQIGQAAIRRDGTSLGTLLIGLAQYGAVTTCWVAVFGALVLASAGLTTGLLHGILDIDGFAGYPAGAGWPDKVGGTVAATVLGLCSLFLLIPAGFGYVLIMLVREGVLLILTATAPIAAAGALGTGTRAWLWKSLRWFLAACLTAPLLALVLGLGVQVTRAAFPDEPATVPGANTSQTEGGQWSPSRGPVDPAPANASAHQEAAVEASQVGMAVVGAAIMVVGCFCPMALFRLLAFVDPGTASGASLRSTLQASNGIGGLFTRPGAAAAPATAAQTGPDGRAASEQAADAETGNRFQSAAARALPVAGRGVADTMRLLGGLATHAASVGVDVTGQAGLGSSGYYDASGGRSTSGRPFRGSTAGSAGQVSVAPGTAPDESAETWDGGAPTSVRPNSDRPSSASPGTPPGAEAEPAPRGVADHPPPPTPAPAAPSPTGATGRPGVAGLADDAAFLA